jgi:hypothetical protein
MPVLIVGALIAAIVKVVMSPFDKGANRTPEEVAAYLRTAIDGTANEETWEDFEKVPIRDGDLETIRKQAIAVKWPLDSIGRETFEDLLRQLAELPHDEGRSLDHERH